MNCTVTTQKQIKEKEEEQEEEEEEKAEKEKQVNDMTKQYQSDEALIQAAEQEIQEERLLVAAKFLRCVKHQDLLSEHHKKVLQKAADIQTIIDLHLTSSPVEEHSVTTTTTGDEWHKQGESHGDGKRNTIIYYKVDHPSKELTCRIETPIESSLLVPLLAVFNESDLYQTWMPKWSVPKMGVRQSLKLKEQPGRGAQIQQVTVDMPFPINDREVVLDTYAVDAIEELGLISLRGTSLEVGAEDGLILPPEPGITRIDFDCGWVIRKCPKNHPCLAKKSKHNPKDLYPKEEQLLLLSLTQYTNAHVKYVPQSFINFCTRTALSGQWASLLQVAQDVRDGKRPDHAKAIQQNPELYDWVKQRIEFMLAKLDDDFH